MAAVAIFGSVLLLAFIGQITTKVYTSNGSGGELCANRTCLLNKASCVNATCMCNKRYTYGRGHLACYRKNEFRTEVTNDPNIISYNDNSFDMPIPCRYLLTHVVLELKNKARAVVGACELMVHTFHSKAKGKMYVGGTDAAFRVEMNNGSRFEMSIRVYGKAKGGQYNFVVKTTNGDFLPDGPWGNQTLDFKDPATGLKIRIDIDKQNNLAIISAKRCGCYIVFRPYDVVRRRDQLQTPGMAVATSCSFRPEFDSVDKVIALVPKLNHNGFDINSIRIPGLTEMETMIYRVFVSGVIQNQPGGNDACSAARESVLRCNLYGEIQKAFYECIWILRSPRFINCYDKTKTGLDTLRLFNSCVDIYCNAASCNYAIGMINATNCEDVRGYPRLHRFVNGSRCP